jgi:hypothetical protein
LKFDRKKILSIVFLLGTFQAHAQLVMDNNPYVFITSGACLIVDNTATNGIITQNPSGAGNIISEAEDNRVVWKTKTSTGNFVVPFTVTGTKIPLTVNIGTAGTGSGDLILSTYNSSPTNTPWPTGVASMNGITGVDNSLFVLDRFWIIDAANYTTKPALNSLIFTYRDGEYASPNTITEANLKAQRYNTTAGSWENNVFLDGTDNSGANTVTTGVVSVTNFYKYWTLVDYNHPLPIELLSFNGICRDGNVSLMWSTASETNNDFFTLERSSDGQNWEDIAIVEGAGISTSLLTYSYIDDQPYSGISYYRLKQTDYDGSNTSSSVITVSCNNESTFELLSIRSSTLDYEIVLTFAANEGEQYYFGLYNSIGQLIKQTSDKAVSGINEVHVELQDVSEGIYIVTLQNSSKYFGQKILLK